MAEENTAMRMLSLKAVLREKWLGIASYATQLKLKYLDWSAAPFTCKVNSHTQCCLVYHLYVFICVIWQILMSV